MELSTPEPSSRLGQVELPPSSVSFPPATTADADGMVVEGGDLEPGTLLAAYRAGLFPMLQVLKRNGMLGWYSPDPRGILTLDRLHVSKSLRRMRRKFVIRVDTAFEDVIEACAQRAEGEHAWLAEEIREAYVRLHHLGWAHSVETWTIPADEEPSMLVGGLYGVAIGGLFAGESMFHRQRDASKVALVALVELLRSDGLNGEGRFIDVQWLSPYMASMGATEVRREDYLARLKQALALPLPAALTTRKLSSPPIR